MNFSIIITSCKIQLPYYDTHVIEAVIEVGFITRSNTRFLSQSPLYYKKTLKKASLRQDRSNNCIPSLLGLKKKVKYNPHSDKLITDN